jgi:hypothetical protein
MNNTEYPWYFESSLMDAKEWIDKKQYQLLALDPKLHQKEFEKASQLFHSTSSNKFELKRIEVVSNGNLQRIFEGEREVLTNRSSKPVFQVNLFCKQEIDIYFCSQPGKLKLKVPVEQRQLINCSNLLQVN